MNRKIYSNGKSQKRCKKIRNKITINNKTRFLTIITGSLDQLVGLTNLNYQKNMIVNLKKNQ